MFFNTVTASNKFTHVYFYFCFVSFYNFYQFFFPLKSGYTELLIPPFLNKTFKKPIFIYVSECKYEVAESMDIIMYHSKSCAFCIPFLLPQGDVTWAKWLNPQIWGLYCWRRTPQLWRYEFIEFGGSVVLHSWEKDIN